jgi:hypothetical protein
LPRRALPASKACRESRFSSRHSDVGGPIHHIDSDFVDRLFAALLHLHLTRRARSLFRARPGVGAIGNYTIAKIILSFLVSDLPVL